MLNSKSESYAKAGVDVVAGYESVEKIKPHIKSTFRPGVLGPFGGFGGMFEPDLKNMERPVLVSGTDGVGTKLKLAQIMDKHDTIGIDAVAMCVNDIVCSGAEPLYFLDYIATGKNRPDKIEQIVSGVAKGCRQAGCALIGGETAEHPDTMPVDDYDIAGFSVGIVDYKDIIDGSSVLAGDVIIGLASSGLHSNGFSLVRKVFADRLQTLDQYIDELGCTLGEELLRPTTIYVKELLSVIRQHKNQIKGISNITGGGYNENIPRMLPEGILAKIDTKKVPVLPIFNMIERVGNIPKTDMFNTFNMGIGMVLAASKEDADSIMLSLTNQGLSPHIIGETTSGEGGVELLW